jgi:hypothetical protein
MYIRNQFSRLLRLSLVCPLSSWKHLGQQSPPRIKFNRIHINDNLKYQYHVHTSHTTHTRLFSVQILMTTMPQRWTMMTHTLSLLECLHNSYSPPRKQPQTVSSHSLFSSLITEVRTTSVVSITVRSLLLREVPCHVSFTVDSIMAIGEIGQTTMSKATDVGVGPGWLRLRVLV